MSKRLKLLMIMLVGFILPGLIQGVRAEEEIAELEEVVVTGTKTEHLLKNAPVETILISREEIERTNAVTVIDVLKWIPGIKSVGRYKPMGRDVYSVGGLSSEYTLILIDGQRIEGGHILTELPVNIIERIEVVKGPNSVLYGSDALNGVINIITKTSEKTNANATFAFRSYDSEILKIGFGSMVGKLKFDIGANANKMRGETEESQYDNYNLLNKFKYEFDENIGLRFGSDFYSETTEYTESDKTNFNLGLDWKVKDSSFFKVGSYLWKYDDESCVGGGPIVAETDIQLIQGEVQYTCLLDEMNLVTIGTEILNEEMENSDFTEKKEQTTNSFFIQDEISILERLVIVPAVRLDSHSEWGEETNPKIDVLYKADEKTNLRVSWGQAFKSPDFKDLYRLTYHPVGPTGFWIKGNPDLKPETSVGYRIGVEHRFTNKCLSSIAFFRNDIEDMIKGYWVRRFSYPPPFPVEGEYSYHNIGEVFTQGVEFNLKGYLIKHIMTTLAYTWMNTEDKETQKELTDVPEHRANLSLRYYNEEIGFMLELREEYEGEVFTDEENSEKNDDYFLTHAKISKVVADGVKLFFNVENLFDEESEQIGEGRIFTGGVIVNF
ncbi:TonB-dependent receptor [bacterium]|nr:TonB-dependent receptor [bacterium]